jgi:hypothetical protein
MNTSEGNIKNLEFLVIKSKELLQEQLKSYENSTTKSGILISISTLFIPLVITFISDNQSSFVIKILSVVPIGLNIAALIFLLKVLKPKGLSHGFDFNQFQNQINVPYDELLVFEIGANKSSYEENSDIISTHTLYFKKGVNFIFGSTIFIFSLIALNLFLENSEDKKIDKIYINELNIKKMTETTSNPDNQGNQSQQSTQQTQTTVIPDVPRTQRAIIEKGQNPEPLIKKK